MRLILDIKYIIHYFYYLNFLIVFKFIIKKNYFLMILNKINGFKNYKLL